MANSGLAAWYEEAYGYYFAVMSGAEPGPNEQEWQDFLSQLQWAMAQLGTASGWVPGERHPLFGGVVGPIGTIIHRRPKVRLAFTGDRRTHDIFSPIVIIDVPAPLAQVTAERTTDTRFKPPEEVLKLTVVNRATGAETTYFVHDHNRATITINTSASTQIVDPTRHIIQRILKFRKPRRWLLSKPP